MSETAVNNSKMPEQMSFERNYYKECINYIQQSVN